ncbi:MAG: N-acetyl-gamma-glutamyl-phosphate reductase [Methylobacteriaceae bacterium]|jgi:N-acetyl-gamma-glutamyl-phosphate reductase|nr:N-acetyl-gamma-glutamyl-phosphate reductase [Methylobacteriaceae bacterium]
MRVSIIGATGYAGAEVLRLLHLHPEVEVARLTSESSAGQKISDLYPHFSGVFDRELTSMADLDAIAAESDAVFIALPHGHAMAVGKALAPKGVRIIDLGADYRFADTSVYEKWYKVSHTHKDAKRVYGLAELYRDAIRESPIIGNAGCHTTAAILALAPLVRFRLIELSTIQIDSKSGVSGAGRAAKPAYHLPELYDSFKAYSAVGHRHTPEIEQALSDIAGTPVIVGFTPYLVPMSRGILATAYAHLKPGVNRQQVSEAFFSAYRDEPFIRLRGEGGYPETKHVRGSNYCDIAWHVDERTHRVIVLSVIDNLVKGAAGQAVQNFNIACGFAETTGLEQLALFP